MFYLLSFPPYHLQYLSEMISYQAILIGGIQHLNHGIIPIRMITHVKPYHIETTEITLAISLINVSIFVKRVLLQRTILLGLHTRYKFLEKSLLDNQRQNLQARKIQQRCLLLYPLLQTLLLLVVGKVSCI